MKVLDIYALMQNDIASIVQRKHYPETIEYELLSEHHIPSPTSRHWKIVLHEIYIKSPGQYGGGNPVCADDNVLAKQIRLTGEELLQATIFLTEHNLVSLESPHFWRITQKGFDAALQNEKIKNDQKIQSFIVYFMCISASAAVVQVVLAAIK